MIRLTARRACLLSLYMARAKTRERSEGVENDKDKDQYTFRKEKIAKERKVIPDPIDDRKFQE